MLKGDFGGVVHCEQGVLFPDLNGINTANIIHLNRFIFLVDETKLEAMQRAHLVCACVTVGVVVLVC